MPVITPRETWGIFTNKICKLSSKLIYDVSGTQQHRDVREGDDGRGEDI